MSRYRKALIAAIPAALATLKVLSDALGDAVVSQQEWLAMLIAGLGALGVYGVANTAPPGQPADPAVSEQSGV